MTQSASRFLLVPALLLAAAGCSVSAPFQPTEPAGVATADDPDVAVQVLGSAEMPAGELRIWCADLEEGIWSPGADQDAEKTAVVRIAFEITNRSSVPIELDPEATTLGGLRDVAGRNIDGGSLLGGVAAGELRVAPNEVGRAEFIFALPGADVAPDPIRAFAVEWAVLAEGREEPWTGTVVFEAPRPGPKSRYAPHSYSWNNPRFWSPVW